MRRRRIILNILRRLLHMAILTQVPYIHPHVHTTTRTNNSSTLHNNSHCRTIQFHMRTNLILFNIHSQVTRAKFHQNNSRISTVRIRNINLTLTPQLRCTSRNIPRTRRLLRQTRRSHHRREAMSITCLLLKVYHRLSRQQQVPATFQLTEVMQPLPTTQAAIIDTAMRITFSHPTVRSNKPTTLNNNRRHHT